MDILTDKLLTSAIEALERVANAQEKLLAIAEEARRERMTLSDQMKKAFQRPIQEEGDR